MDIALGSKRRFIGTSHPNQFLHRTTMGTSMIRSLYAPRPHPYYIVSPDYRRTSAGIRVMHMLCDALNRAGHEAYITTSAVSPQLMTPVLTNAAREFHKRVGVEPIAVYPEVTSGNPLSSDVVARYLLNVPGFLMNDGTQGYPESDLLFAFSRGLMMPDMPDDRLMFLQPVDLGVFKLPLDPAKRIAGKICYYQGRLGTGIDKSLLPPGSIEITGDYPESKEELIDIFQTCEYFYASATTALGAEAILCGCICVVFPGPGAPLDFTTEETGNFGGAWSLAPEDIERARRTLPLFREKMEQMQITFWDHLDHFIEVTQQAATACLATKREPEVVNRLARRDIQARQLQAAAPPLAFAAIAIVVLDLTGNSHLLNKTLNSLAGCPASITPMVISRTAVSSGQAAAFAYIGEHYIKVINRAVSDSASQWLLIIQAGEELSASGLLLTAHKLTEMADCRAVFADEIARIDRETLNPLLRPDFNLDLLLSFPAGFARHWLFRRDLWQSLGGFARDNRRAFELDFILRLIETDGLAGLGHISEPLVIADAAPLTEIPQERQAIERHLQQRGFSEAQVRALPGGRYEVDYGHAQQPMVSIVIVLDGQLAYAQRCVESLLENTPAGRYEILLLDCGQIEPLMLNWLAGIEKLGAAQLKVLRFSGEASPTAVRNHASTEAHGEFVLFLDASAGVIGKDWLQQLLNHAQRPEVGCVGGKLIGVDGTLSRGAQVLGLEGPVGNPFARRPLDEMGYMWRMQVDQDCAAVSGHCLMVRREAFISAGGFDEQMLPWTAADLCLKFSQAGYLNVWTPRAQLLIGDTAEPAPTAAQEDLMYERWLPALARDPAYNIHLGVGPGQAFQLAADAWALPASIGQPSPARVLAHTWKPAVDCQSRLIQPFESLRAQGLIDGAIVQHWLSPVELERIAPEVIVLQCQEGEQHLQSLRRMKLLSRAFKVGELSTLVELPGSRPLLRNALACVDRVVVPSPLLAELIEGLNADIHVVQTRLDPHRWAQLKSARQVGGKPRVGLTARGRQLADIELIGEVIKSLADEVDWVLMGSCPSPLRPFIREVHGGTGADFGQKLASLNLDLALVPLQDTLTNRCASHERLLEFGACGVPVIASDLEPHRGGLPVALVKPGDAHWIAAVRLHLQDIPALQRMGDHLRECVRKDWMLDESGLQVWCKAWLEHPSNN